MESTLRTRVAGVVVVAALAAGGLVLFGGGSGRLPPPSQPPSAAAAPESATPTIMVHVSGQVAEPGLVAMPDGARVADAIAGAGGATAGADLSSINLAELVADADHIAVPSVAAQGPAGDVPVEADDGRVRINSASPADLEQLPGVGPVLAQRIADHRDAHGPFVEVEDLLDVPGIGEAKLAGLRDFVALP